MSDMPTEDPSCTAVRCTSPLAPDGGNAHYAGNRPPLAPSPLVPLALDPGDLTAGLEVRTTPMPSGQVFEPDRAPIRIMAPARRLSAWQMEGGMVGRLPQSPVAAPKGPTESVTLIPMGCARLRISAFPWFDGTPPRVRWLSYGAPPPDTVGLGWTNQPFKGDIVASAADLRQRPPAASDGGPDGGQGE